MRPFFLIDAIDRETTEDPVYLDRDATLGSGRIVLTLGERNKLLSSKHKNRILGICFWKFAKGYYFTKDWEEFLGCPIAPDGIIYVQTLCPDSFCGYTIYRDPRVAKIFCKECNKTYSKPYPWFLDTKSFEKYIQKMSRSQFCEGCGKAEIEWISEDTKLCNSCFKKHGDPSFDRVDTGTKLPFTADIILARRGER